MTARGKGKVYLVGAGPGDPGLITVRGLEVLGQADLVVYDALVDRSLLGHVREGAELIYGGKRSNRHAIPQAEMNEMLASKAREGLRVVRLKGGDPYVFGRGGEEAEVLAERGVEFEIVPGISSVVAAPAYAGIPLTHRDYCSSFTVLTGHEDPTKESSSIDYPSLARLPGTKVVLMGVERIGDIARQLMAHGVAGSTPVAMIRWGTTRRQETLVGILETIAEEVRQKGFKAPAVTIIGGVVDLRDKLKWFEVQPLFGKRVVVTRTRQQASRLSNQIRDLGAEVLEIPTIKIVPSGNRQQIADILLELNSYDWLVFTSPNGVTQFFHYFFKYFEDLRDVGGVKFCAVGPATAEKLRELHLKVDLMPSKYLASEIGKAFEERQESLDNLKVALLRAQVANPELPRALEARGAIVDDIPCYQTVPETEDHNGAAESFRTSGADWITFTSSSTVNHFHARFDLGETLRRYPELRIASIGPETSKALGALSIRPTVEAREHNIDGLVEAILTREVHESE